MPDQSPLDDAIDDVAASSGGPKVLEEALGHITRIAVATISKVDFASISIRHPNGRLETVAPTSPLMYTADGLQYRFNEGPCYDALTDEDVFYCSDLAHDDRWPAFGPRAGELGLLSLLAIRLDHPGGWFMALNLYAHAIDAFDDHHRLAQHFTSHKPIVPPADTQEVERARTARAAKAEALAFDYVTESFVQRQGLYAEEAVDILTRLADR